jgi:hypothetical protein
MHEIIDKKFYLGPKFGTLINKKWITISELLHGMFWTEIDYSPGYNRKWYTVLCLFKTLYSTNSTSIKFFGLGRMFFRSSDLNLAISIPSSKWGREMWSRWGSSIHTNCQWICSRLAQTRHQFLSPYSWQWDIILHTFAYWHTNK